MKIEEMRAIIDKATPGPWVALSDRIQEKQISDQQNLAAYIIDPEARREDLKCCAMMRNNFDKLLKITEVSKQYLTKHGHLESCVYNCNCGCDRLEKLFRELEE